MDTYTLHLITLDPLVVAAESFHTKAHRDMVDNWEFQKALERVRPSPGRSHDENLARVAQIWGRQDQAKKAKAKATLKARIEAAPRVTARKPRAVSRAMPEPVFTEAQLQTAIRAQTKEAK